ncbi:helix-turn-helix domain-containing protein [Peribacillus huizhouensis]|uniref:DNA-binding Lrp family transcriptional regulator n=1 Tax=Peribacillus huizhouensis TaxID=1501239 RepID=A0ABR6CUY9_9BACI|nr:helix-turn-helix domain-containing protein [Peribacillus huizhouensis]MBA9028483.1 DNA-binding Lrp family transcriptional regulator [Peribacillus huizhouensis]
MAKKKIEYIAGVQTYQELASFASVEELNEAILLHLDSLELTKTETEVLLLLARYSCVYPGVSFLCKTKIAEMIGKSRRTVIRVCLKLEQLGAIRQYEMKRTTDMKQTSNAIVIQFIQKEKLVQTDLSSTKEDVVTQEMPENVTPKSCIPFKQKNKELDHTYQDGHSSAYQRFKGMIHNFVSDCPLVDKLYGIYVAQTHYIKNVYTQEELLHIGISAIKTCFQATKRKKIRNLAGYYNGTLSNMLDQLYYDSVFPNFDEEATNEELEWLV